VEVKWLDSKEAWEAGAASAPDEIAVTTVVSRCQMMTNRIKKARNFKAETKLMSQVKACLAFVNIMRSPGVFTIYLPGPPVKFKGKLLLKSGFFSNQELPGR
jgi:hypothetical protein